MTDARQRPIPPADLSSAGGEGLFGQLGATMRGPMRPWMIYVWFLSFAIVAMMIWAAISFFDADTTRDWILYATIFLAGVVFTGMIKIWYYVVAAQHTHTRELRRLEQRLEASRRD